MSPQDHDGAAGRPAIVVVVVCCAEDTRAVMEREIAGRYGTDYDCRLPVGPEEYAATLERLKEDGDEEGIRLAAVSRALHPTARRAVAVRWGDFGRAREVFAAIGSGAIDLHLLRRTHPRDEEFHRTFTEGLYGAATTKAPAFAGGRVFVVGGGTSAGQAAMHLARVAAEVAVLVRGRGVAASMSDYLVREIAQASNVTVRHRVQVVGGGADLVLERLELEDLDSGERETVPADGIFILIRSQPHTEWLGSSVERDRWGFVVTGPDLRPEPGGRMPLPLERSLPGVFAVGDVRHASVKRVRLGRGRGRRRGVLRAPMAGGGPRS